MTSPSRIEINQANAQHSTGPISEDGKQRSSLNALSHGLTAASPVLPSEDPSAYELHLKSFTDDYQPKGATESNLVQALADASWRQKRVIVLETRLLAAPLEPGAAALESQSKALTNLSMHGHRLSRQCERTIAQLREIQKCRHEQEKHDLTGLLDIIDMYKSKGQVYDPSKDGFVFSPAQILEFRQTRNRETRIFNAMCHKRITQFGGK